MPTFTPETAGYHGRMAHAKSRRMPRKQAADLQSALHQAGIALRDDIASCTIGEERARMAGALASVAKGWQAMNDQLRVMRGDPLPGSLRPERPAKSKPVKSTSPMVLSTQPMQMPVHPPLPVHAVSAPVGQPATQPVTVRPIVPAIEPEKKDA